MCILSVFCCTSAMCWDHGNEIGNLSHKYTYMVFIMAFIALYFVCTLFWYPNSTINYHLIILFLWAIPLTDFFMTTVAGLAPVISAHSLIQEFLVRPGSHTISSGKTETCFHSWTSSVWKIELLFWIVLTSILRIRDWKWGRSVSKANFGHCQQQQQKMYIPA